MSGIRVELTASELHMGAAIGAQRHIEALTQQRPDRHGYDGADGWTVHVEGACGELALAKVLGKYWAGTVNTFKAGGDVGDIQVRTRSREHYELIVRDDDRDDDVFVLVVGRAPKYRIVGWIRGKQAKRPEWRQTHGNRPAAYFVPQHALRSVTP